MKEILTLMYELLHRTPTKQLRKEMILSPVTLTDWNNFVNEMLVDYLEENSKPKGSRGAVVEVNESKFGKRV